MKRTLKVVFGILGSGILLLAALVVIPFFIDFNRFKPQIQALVADRVNAKVDFESARLTLLTGLGIKLTKVTLENTDTQFQGTRAFAVDELVFRTELMPLFERKFVGTVKIDRPEIVVVRAGLASNVTSLVKVKPNDVAEPSSGRPPSAPEPTGPALTPAEEQVRQAQIEELKKNIVVQSLSIRDASLTVREVGPQGTQDSVRIRDLDLDVTNIGADRDIRVLLTTRANVNQPGVRVNGPFELSLTTRVLTEGTGWREGSFAGRASFDKMLISAAEGAFSKSEEIPLHLEFEGKVFPDAFELSKLKARLHNLDADVMASLNGFLRQEVRFSLRVENNDLSRLGDVLPKHKPFLVNASLKLDAGVDGLLSEPENLKSRFELKSVLEGSDVDVKWASSRTKPLQGSLDLGSQRLDLVSLLGPFVGATGNAETTSASTAESAEAIAGRPQPSGPGGLAGDAKPGSGGAGDKAPQAKEFELTPEQKGLLIGSDVQAKIKIDELLYKDFRIEALTFDAKLEGLVARLREFSLNAFGGKTRIDGFVNLSTAPLAFKSNVALSEVRMEEVLALVVPEHKDLLAGKASLDLNLEGRGSTFANISTSLNGNGVFAFVEGELKTASVMGIAQEKFDAYVSGLSAVKAADDIIESAEKILANPLVKNSGALKNIDVAKYKAEYDTLRNVRIAEKGNVEKSIKNLKGTLEIRHGRVHLASRNGGRDGELDFKGSVGLDLSLQGNASYTAGEAIEQKMLKQSKYASLLFDEQNNLTFPMVLSGTVKAPIVAIDFEPMRTRFNAKVRETAEKELRKRAEEELNKLLKGNADKALSDLKKRADEEKKKLQDKARAELERAKKSGQKDAGQLLKGILGK